MEIKRGQNINSMDCVVKNVNFVGEIIGGERFKKSNEREKFTINVDLLSIN